MPQPSHEVMLARLSASDDDASAVLRGCLRGRWPSCLRRQQFALHQPLCALVSPSLRNACSVGWTVLAHAMHAAHTAQAGR